MQLFGFRYRNNVVCNFFGIILVYSFQQMAVHRLTTASPPTPPRRSPRLGLHTRKRARVSDYEQQLTPSSSKLPLTPDPKSPRWIKAHKRQKVLDGSSLTSSPPPPPTATNIGNGSTRAGKRKSLVPHDHESESHRTVVKKKRKENIVNDALSANATTSSLKISVTLDTRQGVGNNVSSLSIPITSYPFLTIGMKRIPANRNRSSLLGTQDR